MSNTDIFENLISFYKQTLTDEANLRKNHKPNTDLNEWSNNYFWVRAGIRKCALYLLPELDYYKFCSEISSLCKENQITLF